MDIKKLTTHLNGSQPAKKGQSTSGASSVDGEKNGSQDKVSLDGYSFRKNELLFAKTEYEKQTQASFEKMNVLKAKLAEYDTAKSESSEKAAETEIGQKLNDPAVWTGIARKMLEE